MVFGSHVNTQSCRGLCEHRKKIDILALYRLGMITPKKPNYGKRITAGGIAIRGNFYGADIVYEHQGKPREQKIEITWTSCEFGGDWKLRRHGNRRPWFRCPGCGEMRRVLYSGYMFACRQCHRLKYLSQKGSKRAEFHHRPSTQPWG